MISETPKLQYPLRKIDTSDQAWWLQDSEHKENNEKSVLCTDNGIDININMNNNLTSKIPSYSLRKMDSSDRTRWLEEANQANNSEGLLSCAESNSCSESTKSNSTSSKGHSYVIRKMDSSDRNRWLQEATQEDNINEKLKSCINGVSNVESIKIVNPINDFKITESDNRDQCLQNSEIQKINIQKSTLCINPDLCTSNSLSTENQKYCVRKMDSFDTPWWLKEEKSPCTTDESILSSNKLECTKSDHSLTRSPELMVSYGVRKMDSFDSPWWLSGDENKNSLSDNSINNQYIRENAIESFPTDSENKVNIKENQWKFKNDIESQIDKDLSRISGNSSADDSDNNYLKTNKLDQWNNEYPEINKFNSSESQWWEQDQKNTDGRSTSISIDWSRDGQELLNQSKSALPSSPLKHTSGVRKMDSYDSPSWLASEESETQSHEPRHTSSGDVVSSSSKHMEELVDSSPDWWGEKNESDEFVRTKRTSLRIKKIENIVDEVIEEPINNTTKEPNLQDELDQLMLFIGGCRNIDELLGNEEPPPAAPTTPPDTDSGNNLN